MKTCGRCNGKSKWKWCRIDRTKIPFIVFYSNEMKRSITENITLQSGMRPKFTSEANLKFNSEWARSWDSRSFEDTSGERAHTLEKKTILRAPMKRFFPEEEKYHSNVSNETQITGMLPCGCNRFRWKWKFMWFQQIQWRGMLFEFRCSLMFVFFLFSGYA